jgi:hypothetical protein
MSRITLFALLHGLKVRLQINIVDAALRKMTDPLLWKKSWQQLWMYPV